MVKELSPGDFMQRRNAGNDMSLIDVREDWEVQLAPAPTEFLHIPMSQIPPRIGELDASKETVIICRSGGRSMQVAHFLEQHGFQDIANLSGGILAWSRELDPSIPTY
jgi:rhodanese-related sulfurtransferase